MLSPIDQCFQPFYAQCQTTLFSAVQKCSIESALDGSVPSESLPSHCSTMITTLRKQGPNMCRHCQFHAIQPKSGFPPLSISFWDRKLHPFCCHFLESLSHHQSPTIASCCQALRVSIESKGCVSAVQCTYTAWPSSAATSVQALICCIDLWVSLEQKVLPWCFNMNLKIKRKNWLSSM